MEIEMSFQNDTELKEFEEAYFENVATVIFNHLNLDGYFIFEVNLVDIETIHRINKEYRNIDRPTDVISFANIDSSNNRELSYELGDIYISIDKVYEQAASYNHSVLREFAFLVTHGTLHLLGYDHIEYDAEQVMFKKQEEVLSLLDIKR